MLESETSTASPASTSAQKQKPDYGASAQQLAQRCLDRARMDGARKQRDRQDWFNLLMYRGGAHQWKVWDATSQAYVDRGTDPARGGIPSYVPRCSTNVFAVKIDGVAAILDQTDPAKECRPGSPDDSDRAAAEVAENALPVLFDELGYELDRAQLHKLITLTSAAGYALYFDNDEKYGTDAIVMQQCQDCGEFALPADVLDAGEREGAQAAPDALGAPEDPTAPRGPVSPLDPGAPQTDAACPACGSRQVFDAIDPRTAQPIEQKFPKGKLCGKVVHGFELSVPPGSRTTDTRRLPWVSTHTRMAVEDVLARWPQLKDKLHAESRSTRASGEAPYADALVGLVAPIAEDGRSNAAPTGPVVYELWHDPIDDAEFFFPDGLYLVRVDEDPAEAGPLLYKDSDGRPFKNIIIRQFAAAPGNASGKPPADDLAPIQVQRNIVESLIDLSLMHFAAPTEYIPLSVTMLDESTGAPGESRRYRSTVPGEHPIVVDGKSPAQGLYERLTNLDEKMDEVSRLNSVLAGERPAGDPTLGEVEILRERGMSAFRAPLDALVQFEQAIARMALSIAAQTMWTPRFYKIQGDNGGWEVKQFLGADLEGRVDIYIDKASAWPKSPRARQLRLKEGFAIGLLTAPAAQDPELAAKLFSELDLAGLKPSLDADRRQISRALDRWKTASSPAEILPPDPLSMNVTMHFTLKQAFLKTEEAEQILEKKPEVYRAMWAHVQALQSLKAQAAMQSMGMGAPGGAPSPGGSSAGPGGPMPAAKAPAMNSAAPEAVR